MIVNAARNVQRSAARTQKKTVAVVTSVIVARNRVADKEDFN